MKLGAKPPRQWLWPPWEVHKFDFGVQIIAKLDQIIVLLTELLKRTTPPDDHKAVTLNLKPGTPEEQE